MNTERLHLRERTPEVIKHFLSLSKTDQLEYFGIGETRRQLELKRIENYVDNDFDGSKTWDLISLDTNKVLGDCAFHTWKKAHHFAELGYGINENYRRQGLMFEAVQRIIKYGFEEMGLHRIEAFTATYNEASKGLVLKAGFTYEGHMKQRYLTRDTKRFEDSLVYGLLKSDYIKSNT